MGQLRIKDERIKQLEMDNSVVQSASSDNSGIVLKLEEQLKKMEETLAQNDRAHDLKMIKQKGEFEMTSSKNNNNLNITKDITSKYEIKMSDMKKQYESQMDEMRRQLNNVMSQKNDSSNVRESVTIEINKKYETVITALKGDYEKKIYDLTMANEDLIKKYKQMEATYTKNF